MAPSSLQQNRLLPLHGATPPASCSSSERPIDALQKETTKQRPVRVSASTYRLPLHELIIRWRICGSRLGAPLHVNDSAETAQFYSIRNFLFGLRLVGCLSRQHPRLPLSASPPASAGPAMLLSRQSQARAFLVALQAQHAACAYNATVCDQKSYTSSENLTCTASSLATSLMATQTRSFRPAHIRAVNPNAWNPDGRGFQCISVSVLPPPFVAMQRPLPSLTRICDRCKIHRRPSMPRGSGRMSPGRFIRIPMSSSQPPLSR